MPPGIVSRSRVGRGMLDLCMPGVVPGSICCEQQLEILRIDFFDSSAPGYDQRDVVALLDSAEPPDFIDQGRYNTLRR